MNKFKLLVSGWFKYPHSFTYVNLEQLLPLCNKNIDLYIDHRAPLFTNWLSCHTSESPLVDPRYEALLSCLKPAVGGKFYDASFDIAVPPTLTPFHSLRKSCFMVSEYGTLSKSYINLCGGNDSFEYLSDSLDFIVTPSEWSKQAIVRQGVDVNKIKVIPHGVNNVTSPINSLGSSSFMNIRFPKGKIKILHIGTPAFNKGTDLMVETIFKSDLSKHICFIYKGNDSVYGSKKKFTSYVKAMEVKYNKKVPVLYIGDNISRHLLQELINSTDIYFSPFRAEGFNIPVAEAAAYGKALVVSQCPPVTEFLISNDNVFWITTSKKDSDYGMYHEPNPTSALTSFNNAVKFCLNKEKYNYTHSSSLQSNLISWEQAANLLLTHICP